MKLIAVKDVKANVYYTPEAVPNIAVVERYYRSILPENSLARKYPEDFEVYEIGEYDEKTGAVKPSVKLICGMAEIIKPKDEGGKK